MEEAERVCTAPVARGGGGGIKRAAAVARRKAHPRETGRTPGSLTTSEKKGKRARPVGTEHSGRTGPRPRPTPSVGPGAAPPRAKTPARVSEGGAAGPSGARKDKRQSPPCTETEARKGGPRPPNRGQRTGMKTNNNKNEGRAAHKRARDGNAAGRKRPPEGAGMPAAQKMPKSGPSDGGRKNARTERPRHEDRALGSTASPLPVRAGGAGITVQELSVGEKYFPGWVTRRAALTGAHVTASSLDMLP